MEYVLNRLAMALVVLAGCAFALSEPPTFTTQSCSEPPIIDGRLDDECWKAVKPISDFGRLSATAPEHDSQTRFWLTHNDRWLYLALDCRNPEMKNNKQRRFGHDEAVHEDESLEIFLDPDTNG